MDNEVLGRQQTAAKWGLDAMRQKHPAAQIERVSVIRTPKRNKKVWNEPRFVRL